MANVFYWHIHRNIFSNKIKSVIESFVYLSAGVGSQVNDVEAGTNVNSLRRFIDKYFQHIDYFFCSVLRRFDLVILFT